MDRPLLLFVIKAFSLCGFLVFHNSYVRTAVSQLTCSYFQKSSSAVQWQHPVTECAGSHNLAQHLCLAIVDNTPLCFSALTYMLAFVNAGLIVKIK